MAQLSLRCLTAIRYGQPQRETQIILSSVGDENLQLMINLFILMEREKNSFYVHCIRDYGLTDDADSSPLPGSLRVRI